MAKQKWTKVVEEARLDHADIGPCHLPIDPELWALIPPIVQVAALHGWQQKVADKVAGAAAQGWTGEEVKGMMLAEHNRLYAGVVADDWNEKRTVGGGSQKITLKSLREQWSTLPDPFILTLDDGTEQEMTKATARAMLKVVGITLP
jgi:hypothetical protein